MSAENDGQGPPTLRPVWPLLPQQATPKAGDPGPLQPQAQAGDPGPRPSLVWEPWPQESPHLLQEGVW